MPEEESQDIIRVFFQIELAHWFYLDFYVPDSTEFRTVSLKEFAIQNILFLLSYDSYRYNVD